jgi:hypothetical protein
MTATLVLHDGHETTYELQIKTLTVDNTLVETSLRTDTGTTIPFYKQKTEVDLHGIVTKKVR